MRKSLIPTVLAVALVCSPLAIATANPQATSASPATTTMSGHHRMHHAMHRMGLLDQLNLTSAQRTQVKQMFQQDLAQARPGMRALRQKRMAFTNATPGSASYQTAANDLAQAESNEAHARVLRQAALRTRIYNTLTPAQRTKLASIQAKREARIKQWRESHMQHASAPATSSL